MPSNDEILARYERLIPHLHSVQMACWRLVDEGMMRAACRVMAVATGCHFMPRDDDSIATMLNYCCFNLFFHEDRRDLFDLYCAENPPEDDDRRAVLAAHRRSFFSVFEVVALEPRLGARLRDLFTDELHLVVYPRLAEGLLPGLAVSFRVMPLDDFHVPLNGPIPQVAPSDVGAYERQLFDAYAKEGVRKGQPLTAEQRGKIETIQTISALSRRYPELSKSSAGRSQAASPAARPFGPSPPRSGVGRNDACPCGSGKKFKQCCLHRN